MNPPSRRRWFQLRLSTAVLAMFGCGIVLGMVMASSKAFLSLERFESEEPAGIEEFSAHQIEEAKSQARNGLAHTANVNCFHWYGFPWVACRTMERMVLDGEDFRPTGRAEIQQVWYGNLALDAVVCLSPVVLCSIVLEWFLRRREARRP